MSVECERLAMAPAPATVAGSDSLSLPITSSSTWCWMVLTRSNLLTDDVCLLYQVWSKVGWCMVWSRWWVVQLVSVRGLKGSAKDSSDRMEMRILLQGGKQRPSGSFGRLHSAIPLCTCNHLSLAYFHVISAIRHQPAASPPALIMAT